MVSNMNNVYNEPKYDTDMANKGYVDKQITNAVNGVEEDISSGLEGKSQNFGSQPAPPYRLNDTWMNGTDIYICVNERLIGNFVASDWQKASIYDNTKSILDGGVTTDGTLVVAKGGTVAAGLTAYTSGDNGVRIWAGSDINGINSAPFRVTQAGYLYASNANISGTITATSGVFDNVTINGTCTINGGAIKTGTIAAARLESKVITTDNFSAQNINANKITSGTLSTNRLESKVITTDNFSAQNINANKITSGKLSSAGVDIYNGTGFLRMLYTDWANHPYVSALNVAQGGGGISFRTGQERTNLGSGYGTLQLLSGGNAYYLELGTASGVNLNFNSGDRIGFDSDGNDIRLGRLHFKKSDTDRTATMTTANDYSHARVTLYDSGKVNLVATGSESVYASSPAVSSNKVLVGNSGASSKNVKKNITPFTDEKYDKALELLDNIKLYDYEYKYDLYEDRKQYGFIIDEVEKLDKDSEFFKFYKDTANVEGEHLDFARTKKDEPTIDVKFYNPDTLDKYLLTCIKGLQQKIEELEKEIDHLKGGN